MTEDPRCQLERQPPSAQSLEVARLELRETPEVVKESLAKLRELLKAEPDLYYKDDDFVLIKFLRPCKFYPESALALMKRAADFKVKYSSVLKDLMPDDEKESLLNSQVVNVMANRDQKGRRVLIVNIGSKWDTKKVSGDQMFRLFYLVHIGATLEPETQINGVVVILDFEGLGMKQVAQLTPNFSMRLLSFIQDAIPLRLKEVHIVKQPYVFNIVWKVFSPFIKDKLRGRLFFHGSKMQELHKYLAPTHLPENYGGELGKIDYSSAQWYPVIKRVDEEVKEWNKWGWTNK